jgi:hypothetical protein
MDKIEFLILKCLINNEEYARKVLPFIKEEYFEEFEQKVVFQEISKFILEYNKIPTKQILDIEVEKRNDINGDQYKSISQLVDNLDEITVEYKWLIDCTEKWCRDRAIYLALIESIQLVDDKGDKNRDAIPSILQDALSVSFDNHVGHDYLQDYEERFEFYNKKEKKKLNLILNILTKLRKVGSLIKLSISHLLVRVSGNLYSCAMWLAPSCSKDGTFSTLQWKWQKKKLLNELMQIY